MTVLQEPVQVPTPSTPPEGRAPARASPPRSRPRGPAGPSGGGGSRGPSRGPGGAARASRASAGPRGAPGAPRRLLRPSRGAAGLRLASGRPFAVPRAAGTSFLRPLRFFFGCPGPGRAASPREVAGCVWSRPLVLPLGRPVDACPCSPSCLWGARSSARRAGGGRALFPRSSYFQSRRRARGENNVNCAFLPCFSLAAIALIDGLPALFLGLPLQKT